jgi:hemoglobin/transferrin/lactoferrin receptor protein
VRLIAAVENLGDKDYRVHGSGVNQPGRNLVLAVDFLF